MTMEELSQLRWLNREIGQYQNRLSLLKSKAANISAQKISGMPGNNVSEIDRKIEHYVAEIIDLEMLIIATQTECVCKQNKLERWINDIPDSLLRLIFAYRFINGLSWRQVALHIGGDNTEDGVRKLCRRYLDKVNTGES